MTFGSAKSAGAKPGRRKGLSVGALYLALISALFVAPPLVGTAPAAEATQFLGGRGGQYQPAVAGDRVAWEENSPTKPNHYDVFTGGSASKTKVNRNGTNAANGGIDGTRLVYQEWDGGDSDLYFFNLNTHNRSSPPAGVNTSSWEYWPSESGDWLLYGRRNAAGTRRIILFNLVTKQSRELDEVGANSHVAPGQVNGDYAVWYRCTPTKKCDVFRYQISTQTKLRLPDADRYQRAPSVSKDGTVYFERSDGKVCEVPNKLMRYQNGDVSPVMEVPFGEHIGDTYVDSDDFGAKVFFDRFDCEDSTRSNLYRIDDRRFPLTVTVGEGGTVRSDPGGIDCEPACEGDYPVGTAVTLTANPDPGYDFAGWSGATCDDGSLTCDLTVDGPRTVSATFDRRPVIFTLSVTNEGGGTVTSFTDGTPDGKIDCGDDCGGSYVADSEVSLTAEPDPGYTFAGWEGDCSGPEACDIVMDEDRSVTAIFQLLASDEPSPSPQIMDGP